MSAVDNELLFRLSIGQHSPNVDLHNWRNLRPCSNSWDASRDLLSLEAQLSRFRDGRNSSCDLKTIPNIDQILVYARASEGAASLNRAAAAGRAVCERVRASRNSKNQQISTHRTASDRR